MSPINLNEFQRSLTDNYVRTSQTVQVALGAGVLILCGVVLFVYATQPAGLQPAADDLQTMQTLTIANLLFAASCYGAAHMMYNRLLSPKQAPLSHARSVSSCLMALRTAMIVRLAMLEGPALFGLVVCLLGSLKGVLQAHPVYWINTVPAAILLAVFVATFPTRERIELTVSRIMSGT